MAHQLLCQQFCETDLRMFANLYKSFNQQVGWEEEQFLFLVVVLPVVGSLKLDRQIHTRGFVIS